MLHSGGGLLARKQRVCNIIEPPLCIFTTKLLKLITRDLKKCLSDAIFQLLYTVASVHSGIV